MHNCLLRSRATGTRRRGLLAALLLNAAAPCLFATLGAAAAVVGAQGQRQGQQQRPPGQSREQDPASQEVALAVEGDKLPIDISVLLDGKPFPDNPEFKPPLPAPRRVFHVSAEAPTEGDGSEARPWKDFQAALCRLAPGDRLTVAPGAYPGSFRIGGPCKDGTKEAPIHVFARGAVINNPVKGQPALAVEKAHWYVEGLQMVLEDARSNAVEVRGPGAHDLVFENGHLFNSVGTGFVIHPGAARVMVSNYHIHHFKAEPPGKAYGVLIHGGARDIDLIKNHVHHNWGAAIKIGGGKPGGGASAPVENVSVVDNKLHDDKGSAVEIESARGVRIARNKIYNYRPARDFKGEAIAVGPDAKDMVIEQNHFAEATVGVLVGARGGGAAASPENVLVQRNYLENRLTAESVAFDVASGRNVRVYNNTVDHYAEAIRLAGAPRAAGLSVANNLVLSPSKLAFRIDSPQAVTYFDHNVFSWAENKPMAQVGQDVRPLEEQLAGAKMAHTKIVRGADILDRDLGKVSVANVVDAGKVFEGVAHKGNAPDVGVAEK